MPVVCAVLEDNAGRVLVAQRPAHKHLGFKWEFAGGKVESGEQPEHAIVREMKEELNCDVVVRRPLPRFVHDYGSVVIDMIPFVCRLASSSQLPDPQEHVAIRWVTLGELDALDLAPADRPVVQAYRVAMRRTKA